MRAHTCFLVLIVFLSQSADAQEPGELMITFVGHACFVITTPAQIRIVTDPIDLWGLRLPSGFSADVVTVSHNHLDHNAVSTVSGTPRIIYGTDPEGEAPFQQHIPINETVGDVTIRNVSSYHSSPSVSPQLNSIFLFEVDGFTIAHLGDLGRTLTDEQVDRLGRVDILMIPVGGQYTLTLDEVDETVRQINPTIAVIPMHYRTETVYVVPNGVEDYVGGKQGVVRVSGNTYTVHREQSSAPLQYVVYTYSSLSGSFLNL